MAIYGHVFYLNILYLLIALPSLTASPCTATFVLCFVDMSGNVLFKNKKRFSLKKNQNCF